MIKFLHGKEEPSKMFCDLNVSFRSSVDSGAKVVSGSHRLEFRRGLVIF